MSNRASCMIIVAKVHADAVRSILVDQHGFNELDTEDGEVVFEDTEVAGGGYDIYTELARAKLKVPESRRRQAVPFTGSFGGFDGEWSPGHFAFDGKMLVQADTVDAFPVARIRQTGKPDSADMKLARSYWRVFTKATALMAKANAKTGARNA